MWSEQLLQTQRHQSADWQCESDWLLPGWLMAGWLMAGWLMAAAAERDTANQNYVAASTLHSFQLTPSQLHIVATHSPCATACPSIAAFDPALASDQSTQLALPTLLCCSVASLCAAQMSATAVVRTVSSRLSTTITHYVSKTSHTYLRLPAFSVLYSYTSITPPRRSFSLDARHIKSEPQLAAASASVSSVSQLSFAQLVARTSSFLVDYYEAPTASPVVAAQLLTALQRFDVDGQQRQLKEKLVGELDELVNEGKRRERSLGDDTQLSDKHDDIHEHEHHDDVLRFTQLDHDDHETVEQRIVARPPLPSHLHDADYHVVEGDTPHVGGGVARGKFDSAYSTDQLLMDSLPTLKEEEVVQMGRRDVKKLMATRE